MKILVPLVMIGLASLYACDRTNQPDKTGSMSSTPSAASKDFPPGGNSGALSSGVTPGSGSSGASSPDAALNPPGSSDAPSPNSTKR